MGASALDRGHRCGTDWLSGRHRGGDRWPPRCPTNSPDRHDLGGGFVVARSANLRTGTHIDTTIENWIDTYAESPTNIHADTPTDAADGRTHDVRDRYARGGRWTRLDGRHD
jgi:hypothetical protein